MDRFEYSQLHLGGQARLLLYAPTPTAAEEAARRAFAEVARLEEVFSDYRPDSELSRLSDRAGAPPVRVSDALWTVMERAQQVAEASDGAFDITVGPLVALWRLSRKTGRLPTLAALREAKARVGWRLVELDARRRTVRLARPGMRLDAGGIAKGYIGDRAIAALRAAGIRCALIELGGDLVASEASPGTRGWSVAVGATVIALAHAALSTSGSAEQFVEIGGKRYAHLVDPRTGLGLTERVAVSVRARAGLAADPLATACCILGTAHSASLLRHWPEAEATFHATA